MKFFKGQNSSKNILVLGDKDSGKRSFLYYFKEGKIADANILSVINEFNFCKNFKDGTKAMLNFVMNTSNDAIIPSSAKTNTKIDLVVILLDLSKPDFAEKREYYNRYANMHFSGKEILEIGTKADIKCTDTQINDLIATSSKTGQGMEQFEDKLKASFGFTSGQQKSFK